MRHHETGAGGAAPRLSIVVADQDLLRGHALVRAFARLRPAVRCVHAPSAYAALEAASSTGAAAVVLDDGLVPEGSHAIVRELVATDVPPAIVVLASTAGTGDGHPNATTVVSRRLQRDRVVEAVHAVAEAEDRRRTRRRRWVSGPPADGSPPADAFLRIAALMGSDPETIAAVAAVDGAADPRGDDAARPRGR